MIINRLTEVSNVSQLLTPRIVDVHHHEQGAEQAYSPQPQLPWMLIPKHGEAEAIQHLDSAGPGVLAAWLLCHSQPRTASVHTGMATVQQRQGSGLSVALSRVIGMKIQHPSLFVTFDRSKLCRVQENASKSKPVELQHKVVSQYEAAVRFLGFYSFGHCLVFAFFYLSARMFHAY